MLLIKSNIQVNTGGSVAVGRERHLLTDTIYEMFAVCHFNALASPAPRLRARLFCET